MTFHKCFLTSFGSFGKSVLENKIFRNLPIRNKNCLLRPCLLTDRDEMCNLDSGLPINASYQVSSSFRGQDFLNSAIQKKESPVAAMFVNGLGRNSNLYRGPSIDDSYQVSVHLGKRFQRRRFIKIGQSQKRIACGGHFCQRIGTKWAIFIEHLP